LLKGLCTTNVQNLEILLSKIDELVKSPNVCFSVIPAKAGIQLFQILKNSLDSGFHRSDDFLRDHQNWFGKNQPLKSPPPPLSLKGGRGDFWDWAWLEAKIILLVAALPRCGLCGSILRILGKER
jgi:hypothetical protein